MHEWGLPSSQLHARARMCARTQVPLFLELVFVVFFIIWTFSIVGIEGFRNYYPLVMTTVGAELPYDADHGCTNGTKTCTWPNTSAASAACTNWTLCQGYACDRSGMTCNAQGTDFSDLYRGNFDSLKTSMLTLFTLLTMENYPDVTFPLQDKLTVLGPTYRYFPKLFFMGFVA
jgi:hypothetical protein